MHVGMLFERLATNGLIDKLVSQKTGTYCTCESNNVIQSAYYFRLQAEDTTDNPICVSKKLTFDQSHFGLAEDYHRQCLVWKIYQVHVLTFVDICIHYT